MVGTLRLRRAEVVLPVNPVENRVDLQSVIALNVLEAVGPGGKVRAWIADWIAGNARGRGNAFEGDDIGVDFRRVEIVERNRADPRGYRGVRWMLVGPCGVSASLVNDAEDAVGADKIPGIHGTAAIVGVADQSLRVDGGDATVDQCRARRSAVQLALVDVDAFFVLGSGPGWRRIGSASAGRHAVARGLRGRIIIPGIRDVVIDAGQGRASASDDRGQAREGVRRFRGVGGNVIDAVLAQSSNGWAKGSAIVNRTDAVGAILKINRVHTVDADQQNAFDVALQKAIVLGDRGTHEAGNREGK